ncbi:MAG: hypothetical protein K6A77_09765 [Clostridiales bacterium]|nr:hypothetical protein [Clostridiales bacterium]
MKKISALLIGLAMLLMLAGCTELKTYEIPKDGAGSPAAQESSKEDAAKPAAESEDAEEESVEETTEEAAEASAEETPAEEAPAEESTAPASGAVYDWGEMKVELNEVSEDIDDPLGQMPSPEGKWVKVLLTVVEGEMECSKVSDLVLDEGIVKLNGQISKNITQSGIKIVDDTSYSVGTISVFFDVDPDYVPNLEDVYVGETSATATEDAEAPAATADGIEVVSDKMYIPESGGMAYTPSGASGYFAVDGHLKAQTTIGIAVDPPGILNYDLSLKTDAAMTIEAKIEVYKDGTLLAEYTESGLELPAGETTINACAKTGEDAVCSGEYSVKFYINGAMVKESTGSVS